MRASTQGVGSSRRDPARGWVRILALAVIVVLVAACSATSSSPSSAASAAPSAPPSIAATPEASVAPTEAGSPSPTSPTPVVGNGKKQWAWAVGLNELPIIIQMKKEMVRYSAERGWEVLFDPGTGANIQPMISSIQAWITAGVPSITVTPFEPSAFVPLANQAIDKGLIWLAYGTPMEPRMGQIAFPQCDAAKIVADAVVDHINKNDPNAKVLITASFQIPAVKCKWEDVKAAIESRTKATVVGTQGANTTVEGLQVTQATLTAHPDLTVVIGTNDDVAVGASQAFKAAGVEPAGVYIIGFDGSQEALQQIHDGGYMKADAALNLRRLAAGVAELNIRLASSGQPTTAQDFIEPPVLVQFGDPLLEDMLAFYKE